MISKPLRYPMYPALFEPWNRLALNSPVVISMRLMRLPFLWISDPMEAGKEVQKMFSEKHDAWHETVAAMAYAPMHIAFDTMMASMSYHPHRALSNAMVKSSRRIARPANKRVSANRRRLRKN